MRWEKKKKKKYGCSWRQGKIVVQINGRVFDMNTMRENGSKAEKKVEKSSGRWFGFVFLILHHCFLLEIPN